MIKRKLVMACLFVLAVQLARVCLLADTKDQQMTLAEEIPDGTEVSVSGTVEWVREKEKITAVCLRKNQVRYAGTILKESKLVVCIRPDQLKEQLNIGSRKGKRNLLMQHAIPVILIRKSITESRVFM